MLNRLKRYRVLETACALIFGVLGFVVFAQVSKSWSFYLEFPQIVGYAVASTLLLLALSGANYYFVGLQATITSLLSFGKIIIDTIEDHLSGVKPQLSMNVLNGILAITLCAIPFLILVLNRVLFTFKFMNTSNKKQDFALVFKIQSVIILAAYLGYFIINFITGRKLSGEIRFNIIPFETIKEYYLWFKYNERIEPVVLFVGNILVLAPLGFYLSVLFPRLKRRYIILFPIILSGAIEISQLIFKNGHCDIDDFILNCTGFYIGVWFKLICDFVRRKLTKGEEESIFTYTKTSI
ncbi:MAG: VanZ family protein [Oscillospiraceae bacterium]|jgi:glycopeptide antibiotics resistance protein|nr:VanZ family protein [Oscillospiraceae bacterium]